MANAEIQLVSCFGNADAEINLNTSGGDGNYSGVGQGQMDIPM